jgi:Cof subfamily protein (haloacid dehalogenase superfamily)
MYRPAMTLAKPRALEVGAPRLVACDIDGTLLDPGGCLRPAVKAAIEAVRAAGVEVVLATGRSPWAVAETARTLGLDGPQIVMNGGACVSPVTGQLVWARRLAPELVADGLEFAAGSGASPLLGFLDGNVRRRAAGVRTDEPDFAGGSRLREVDSLVELADRGPVRLYVPTPPEEHARMLAEAAGWFGDRASIVHSDALGLEIMAPGTNKGRALRAVAATLGIDRRQVAAIGDGPNDREMLAYAGRSAALLPAPDSIPGGGLIPSGGTLIVPSSAHDGAVEALRFFFPRLKIGPGQETVAAPAARHRSVVELRRPGSSDWDDDPEPDLGLSAA